MQTSQRFNHLNLDILELLVLASGITILAKFNMYCRPQASKHCSQVLALAFEEKLLDKLTLLTTFRPK